MCILKTDEGMLNKYECYQTVTNWESSTNVEACAEAVCVSPEAPQHGDLCFVEDFARWNLKPTTNPFDDPHQTFFYANAMSDEYCKANMHWDLPPLDEMKESDQFCVGKPNFSGTLLDSDTITSHWKDGNPSGYGIICSEKDENLEIGGQALFCQNSATGEMEFKGLYSGNHVECEFDIAVPWVLNDLNKIWDARKSPIPVKVKPGMPNIFTRLSDHYDWIQSNMGSISGASPFTAEQETGLSTHNNVRCFHGAQAMTLSVELNASAQAYAEELAANDALSYNNQNVLVDLGEGENLYMSSDWTTINYDDAVWQWYNEVQGFDWNQADMYQGWAHHFQQVIWNDSTELGMGHAISATGKLYIVGRYKSRGNIMTAGEFSANIFPVVNDLVDCAATTTGGTTTTATTTTTTTTTSTTTTTTTIAFTAEQEEGLLTINNVRCFHDVQEMQLSAELNASAQAYAEELAANDALTYSSWATLIELGEGETVYMSSDWSTINYDDAVWEWYNEIQGYNWNDNDIYQSHADHFQQVIWADSTELGMGHAISASGNLFIVGRYKARGNVNGQFSANMFPAVHDFIECAGTGRKRRSARNAQRP